jgi:mRNA interferase HigB
MRVIKPSRIHEFGRLFADAKVSLSAWLRIARHADWQNIVDVRLTFPSADPVKVKSGRIVVVFNICGNKYRLIVATHYNTGMLYILRFMTHAEYDKEKWKGQL